ncbi:MAG: hypothetical protein AAF402_00795 [Pseudomonadota bacterium]
MEGYAVNVLWITALLLPAAIFLVGPKLRKNKLTLIRAMFAIGCGWCYWIAYTIAAQTITSGMVMNGASYAFVILLGWIMPTTIVVLAWAVYWFFFLREPGEKSNKETKSRTTLSALV